MTDSPVTTREIADLLLRIRSLSDNPTADPAERAETLACTADLLARLAGQRAEEWDCEHARPSPSTRTRSPSHREPVEAELPAPATRNHHDHF